MTPQETQARVAANDFIKAQQAARALESRRGSMSHEEYQHEKAELLDYLQTAYLRMPDSGYPDTERSRRLTPWGYLSERGSGRSAIPPERMIPPTAAELEARGLQTLLDVARDLDKEWTEEEKHMELPSYPYRRVLLSITRERLRDAYRALGFDKKNPFGGKTEVTPDQIGKLREYMKDNPFENPEAGRKLREEAVEQ